MDKFVLKSVKEAPMNIDKDTFEKATRLKYPYVQVNSKGSRSFFATCSYCENPVQIRGLYKKPQNDKRFTKPYGAHTGKGIPGLPPYISENYEYCPFGVKGTSIPKETRKTELTNREREIYELMRDHFDQAIYVVKKNFGIFVSTNMAERLLQGYVVNEGYLYPHHTANNIPWMLMYLYDGIDPYGMWIAKKSRLADKIRESKILKLESVNNEHYEKLTTTEFARLNMMVWSHHQIPQDDHSLKEYVKLDISRDISDYGETPKWETLASIRVDIDDGWFMKLINSDKANDYRNEELLEIARKIMVDI